MSRKGEPGPSMDCEQLVELVTDYLEGALPSSLRSEVEAHLALCPGCGVYLDQMRRTIDELGAVPVDSLSPPARAALMAAFRSYRPGGAPTS
ncbi:MAG: anti-sigma factor family protein [Actinomycetes bacterium]